MDNEVLKKLMCVCCKNTAEMTVSTDGIICNNCNQVFPSVAGIPVILNEKESIFAFSDFTNQKNLFFDISKKGKTISLMSKLTPSIGGNNLGTKNFKFLEEQLRKKSLDKKPRVLVVGASIIGEGMTDFVHSENLIIVESDVSFGPRTKVIFDSHSIPYCDESFDCVVVQAVLEHVIDPEKCVREIYRVLRPSGMVYAETPFMQQVHGGAYDFTRYTRSGHRKLFRHFKEVKSGSTAGSGTSLAWSYQYFLLSLFGYTNVLRLLVKVFARFTGFWLKYFDYLTVFNTRDNDNASGFYFIGSKSQTQLSDKELINYYK